MKLYTVPAAPNPEKVVLYLAEREARGSGIDLQNIIVNTLKGEHKAEDHLKRNPFGTLPVLELTTGDYLRESLAILEYFEEKFPDGALLSENTEERAQQRDIERIADLRLGGPMGIYVHATKSPVRYPPDPEKAAVALKSMQKPFEFLDNLLSDGRTFLTGDQVNLADCTLGANLQFVRFIGEDVLGDWQNLRAWDQRYRKTASAKSVMRW